MKNNTRLFTALMFLLTTGLYSQNSIMNNTSKAAAMQERCGTAIIHDRLMNSDPDYKNRIQQNEALIQQIINSGAANTRSVYTIPVVVHVLHLGEAVGTGTNISDAQINSAIANLNTCYGGSGSYPLNIGVQFQLAQRKYDCTSSTGIVRVNASGTSDYGTNGITSGNETTVKALSKWPNTEYYNIWIVSEIDNNGGGAGTQGYAYYPGAGPTVDGAVILYNSFGYDPTNTLGYNLKAYTNRNVTTLHELGHAFNVKHTFEGDGGGGSCPANTSCSTEGDLCCDTEAHKRTDGDCGATGTTCSGQSIVNIVNNIMAYSSDACQVVFTADQKARMLAAITGTRVGLLTSPGLTAISGSAPSVAKSCSPQTSSLPNGFGMGVFGFKIGSTEYSSGGADADGGFRNNWCSNFNLTVNTLYSVTVSNGTANNEKVKVYIDYNNDGDFDDAGENVFSGNTGAKTHSGSFTTPAAPVTGQALWVRVISDFSSYTISGPCYVPVYGQVEDFSVLFPASGASKLITAQCGATFTDLTGNFVCDAVTNAQDYEFEFTNAGLGYSFTKTRGIAQTSILKTLITGLQFGQTYNVRVRAKIGGVWGSYGSTCTVTISGSVPTTQVAVSQCGQTLADLSGNFDCIGVAGAQDYEWEFTNAGLSYSYTRIRGIGYTSIPKTWIVGLQHGVTYNVRVKVKVGGVWGSYGSTCTIALAAISVPSTEMVTAECNQTIADLSGVFTCNAVNGAQDYEWEFTNAGLAFTYTKARGVGYTAIPKNWILGLQFGQTYAVRVRAKVGNTWGSYGTSCNVTLSGSVPTTAVSVAQCGQSMNLIGMFDCISVPGAQDYQWEFVNAGLGYSYTRIRGINYTSIPKAWITGLLNGVTYDVRVKAKVAGIWGSYGSICTITINTALGYVVDNSTTRDYVVEENRLTNVSVYPNPSNSNGFNISYQVLENEDPQTLIEVYNVLGEKVINKQITSIVGINEIKLNTDGNLPVGYYVLVIKVNNNIVKKNIVVQ